MKDEMLKRLETIPEARAAMEQVRSEIMDRDYTALGIYEYGDVCVTPRPSECFLDCTCELAFISELRGEPAQLSMGIKAYRRSQTDCVILSINSPEAWALAAKHGFLDGVMLSTDFRSDPGRTPLRWALGNTRIDDPEVYDMLFAIYPETYLADMCWHAGTASAARWLMQEPHKADPYYAELLCDMRTAVAAKRLPDTEKILEIFYGPAEPEEDPEQKTHEKLEI